MRAMPADRDDPYSRFRAAAVISFALLLPFLVLELRARRSFDHFPGALFTVLWLLPFAFVLVWPRAFRVGEAAPTRTSAARITGGVALLLIASLWVTLVADQMPCFLGAPNCD